MRSDFIAAAEYTHYTHSLHRTVHPHAGRSRNPCNLSDAYEHALSFPAHWTDRLSGDDPLHRKDMQTMESNPISPREYVGVDM